MEKFEITHVTDRFGNGYPLASPYYKKITIQESMPKEAHLNAIIELENGGYLTLIGIADYTSSPVEQKGE